MRITLMAEDQGGNPADVELSDRWAGEFGLTFPILADPGWGESNKYEQDFGIPTYHLLGRDLTIRILDGFVSESDIEDALAEPVPEVPWDQPPSIEDVEDLAADAPVTGDSPLVGSETSPFGGCAANVAGQSGSGVALLALLGLLWRRRRD